MSQKKQCLRVAKQSADYLMEGKRINSKIIETGAETIS
jgi:hypothetical protein